MPSAAWAVETAWRIPSTGSDWLLDPNDWLGDVPNGPGDVARLFGASGPMVDASVSQPVTVGELKFSGHSSVVLDGEGGITLDNLAGASAIISAIANSNGRTFNVATPIIVAAQNPLELEANSFASVVLSGGVTMQDGALRKVGDGTVVLASEFSGLTGGVDIEAGELRLERTQILAHTAATVAPGGTLKIVSPFDTGELPGSRYSLPSLNLNGGTLQAAVPLHPIGSVEADVNLSLLSDNTIKSAGRTKLILRGSITGDGGLSFLHSGENREATFPTALTAYIDFIGDADYTGHTVIGAGVSLHMINGAQLGDTVGVTRVMGGQLVLTGGGRGERISVDRGRLVLSEAEVPYGHEITIRSGRLSGEGQSSLATPVILSTDVQYSEGIILGEYSTPDGFLLQGSVSGTGSVGIMNKVGLQAGLSARGNLYSYYRGDAELSGPVELAGEAFVEQGVLRLSGDHDLSSTPFRLAPTHAVPGANLVVAGQVSIGELVLDTGDIGGDDGSDFTAVLVEEGATLNLTSGVQFRGGKLSGNFTGQKTLVKQGAASGYLADGAASSFQRIDLEEGRLVIEGGAGPSPAAIYLSPHETTRLELKNTGAYSGAVYLNSVPGRHGAVVSVGSGSVFDGVLDLGTGVGEVGGILGPNASIQGAGIRLGGVVRGGNHTYGGATELVGGGVSLIDSGRLSSTSGIVGGPGASLELDNSGEAALSDRLPDGVPILSNGMTVSLIGRSGAPVSENIGQVTASYGTSGLDAQAPTAAETSAVLRVDSLVRQPGAAVAFSTGPTARIMLDNAPALDDGLIGGWALANGELATYGPNGVVPYSEIHSYATELASATSSDNVRLQNSGTLNGDSLINSLTTAGGEVDLAGYRLTIGSGALSGRSLSRVLGEGELTVGSEAGGELLASGGGKIEVSIVDGAAGPVGLTVVSGDLRLSGANTYTGPTTVNNGARLFVDHDEALPDGGDVAVNGGYLSLLTGGDSARSVGRLEVRGSGNLRGESLARPQVTPSSILLESGSISALDLVGDGPLRKVGSGVADYSTTLRLYTGPITIEGGVLDSYYSPDPTGAVSPAAITIETGGTLQVGSDTTLAKRPLRFDGGVLFMEDAGGVSASIELLPGGGTIRGGERTTEITSPVSGEGDLVIQAGVGREALMLLNADFAALGGELRLTGGPIRLGQQFRYEKPLTLAASRVTTSGGAPFGEAVVTVPAESQLIVDRPLHANLNLAGGVLQLSAAAASLSGTQRVAGYSHLFISGSAKSPETRASVAGEIHLDVGSHLVVAQAPGSGVNGNVGLFQERVKIESDLIVHGVATLTSFDCLVELAGALSPASAYAELRLEGNDTFEFNGSIELAEGTTLALVGDGTPAGVMLSGATSSLAGSGQFIGDVVLAGGASVSPGDSPGVLSIDGSLTFGPGAVYQWEIADALGVAGVQHGWDLLAVSEQLLVQSTPEEPAVIRVASVVDGGPLGTVDHWDPSQSQSWLIATAASIEGFDRSLFVVDAGPFESALGMPAAAQFTVQQQGETLLLVYTAPEPAATLLVCLLLGASGWQRRRRW
ncbi:autotransporter-associated beta strand repeat-containing protein [Posidoniimonas polymericola]|uniref:autotransporter-associated beta strand repeat-containing protein n=1 Tax=Posidoniimonas polymericola TaxID=2528002 RepID=UPI0018D43758|nr:autotransporter-associated beta strand repeat-containing protein [Posidoniimonas polymericola]